jgi:hypothetical protein
MRKKNEKLRGVMLNLDDGESYNEGGELGLNSILKLVIGFIEWREIQSKLV